MKTLRETRDRLKDWEKRHPNEAKVLRVYACMLLGLGLLFGAFVWRMAYVSTPEYQAVRAHRQSLAAAEWRCRYETRLARLEHRGVPAGACEGTPD